MDKWIICLKHGQKYNHEYVNRLHNMAKRHSTMPFNFACITEDAVNIDKDIHIIPLPKSPNISGWWFKPWVFSKDLPVDGQVMFFDLDIVIVKNIDHLWNYNNNSFTIIRDFNRSTIKDWSKFNSSIFKFPKGAYSFVWENFIKDTSVMKRLHGDQDWIFNQIKTNFQFWPDDWIQSYKWEVRNRNDVIRDGIKRKFKDVANPVVKPETKILVFHGDPKPSDVQDPIIVDNWR